MKTKVVSSLAEPVGKLWRDLQNEIVAKGEFFVASPLSNTPLPIYQWIVDHSAEFDTWKNVRFVLMDEMVESEKPMFRYVSADDPASYEGFARKHLLDPLFDKTGVRIPIIKPELRSITRFKTPIDLLILAIGIDGNYANVMPGTPLEIGWHIAHLTEAFRQTHTSSTGAFAGSVLREYGMSLGPQQVLTAKNVVVIASGERKKVFVKKLESYASFDPAFPLSVVHHSHVSSRVEAYFTSDAQPG